MGCLSKMINQHAAGSARAVNRRYIAMYVARKDRTNASALFVSLSAVGMALGPLLALPLSHVPEFKLFGALRCHPGDVTSIMRFCRSS